MVMDSILYENQTNSYLTLLLPKFSTTKILPGEHPHRRRNAFPTTVANLGELFRREEVPIVQHMTPFLLSTPDHFRWQYTLEIS